MNIDNVTEEEILDVFKEFKKFTIRCNCYKGRSGAVFGGITTNINKQPKIKYQKCQTCNGKRYLIPRKELKISIIAAKSRNNVIGKNNKLPWNIPEDLKYFREKTKNKPVIMGRKTYESIGKVLPNRRNIIVTRKTSYRVDNATVTNSLRDAILAAITSCDKEVMIIGGAEIYREALPYTNKIYLTVIDEDFDGDVYFPELEEKWKKVSCENHHSNLSFSFNIFKIVE